MPAAKGDLKVCGGQECPADCGTVRVSVREGCSYCQCGLPLAPGEEEVPIDEPCQPLLVEGTHGLATKVCRAPDRTGAWKWTRAVTQQKSISVLVPEVNLPFC